MQRRPPARDAGRLPRAGAAPRFDASREQQEQLATRFFGAAEEGDLEGLELAYDVLLHADGGGEAPATYVRSTAAPGWRAR
jgi:hypothetical protein